MVKDEKRQYFRGSRKYPTFREGSGFHEVGLPKNGGLRQFPDLMRGAAWQERGEFLRGDGDTPMHAMYIYIYVCIYIYIHNQI